MGRILREKDMVVIRTAEPGVQGVNTKKGCEGRGPLKPHGQDEKESVTNGDAKIEKTAEQRQFHIKKM